MPAAQDDVQASAPALEVTEAEKANAYDTENALNAVNELQVTDPGSNEKSWKIEDQQIVPKNNLPLVFFSLLLATFLVRCNFYCICRAH